MVLGLIRLAKSSKISPFLACTNPEKCVLPPRQIRFLRAFGRLVPPTSVYCPTAISLAFEAETPSIAVPQGPRRRPLAHFQVEPDQRHLRDLPKYNEMASAVATADRRSAVVKPLDSGFLPSSCIGPHSRERRAPRCPRCHFQDRFVRS